MSSTAQGVTAVKQCRFPPLLGYKTDGPQGAVTTLSTDSLANLTAKVDLFAHFSGCKVAQPNHNLLHARSHRELCSRLSFQGDHAEE
nr:hypothetical protein Iba_chr03cCG7070 [Ipomoea batatas]